MLEDLEATQMIATNQPHCPNEFFIAAKSASVRLADQVLRLQHLVFAADFLLGRHLGRTLAITYDAIYDLQLMASGHAASQVSKLTLRNWIETLPDSLQVSATVRGSVRLEKSVIVGHDRRFLVLTSSNAGRLANVVPISAIQSLEFEVVDKAMSFGA